MTKKEEEEEEERKQREPILSACNKRLRVYYRTRFTIEKLYYIYRIHIYIYRLFYISTP